MATLKQSTAYNRAFLMIDSTDHISGKTGLTVSVSLSKNAGAFASAGGTITEISNGWYKIALSTTDTNTLGDLAFHATATGADATDFCDQVTANILGDTLPANLTQVNAHSVTDTASGVLDVNAKNIGGTAQTGRDIGASVLLSNGTGAGQISLSSGAVTVGTNNDKTGYTASTVSDKTGYSIASGGIGSGSHAAAELNNIADAMLDRNMATGTDSGTDSTSVRTARQALRILRNKASIGSGTLTVTKEDDATASWTAAVTTTSGNPISAVDPT